jgi:hypothetical protein
MTMPMVTAGQDPPGGDIQGRKKGRGSVPDIVVGNAFHITKSDRQACSVFEEDYLANSKNNLGTPAIYS